MNFRLVIRTVSTFHLFLAIVMLAPFFCALIYGEKEWFAFLITSLITASVSGVGYHFSNPTSERMFQKEGFAIVVLGWFISSFFGALPYDLSGVLDFCSAYFETVSGFTTTGATTFSNIEALPRCILFWRCMTNWLGGMGIIVLFVALFSFLGSGGRLLFRSESSANTADGFRPKIRETARRLWLLYLGLTLVQTILLMFCGVNLFESLCLSFSTIATGGFCNLNASIGGFDSIAVEVIITIFMIISGMNFFMLYYFLNRNLKKGVGYYEMLVYLSILCVASSLITLDLYLNNIYSESIFNCFRSAVFQVSSIMTTTGFITQNYELWPSFSKIILVSLMFVGGCAGSTGGGMKVVRFMIVIKFIITQVRRSIHSGLVTTIKIKNKPIASDTVQDVNAFFVISFFLIFLFTAIMSLFGLDLLTAFSSVLATLWNIGPGLSKVGAIENYSFIPSFGKLTLSVCMILGRLELLAVIAFFSPSFWKR